MTFTVSVWVLCACAFGVGFVCGFAALAFIQMR